MKEKKHLDLNQELKDLKGIGEIKSKLYSKLNLHTVNDLLYHYPINYENYKNIVSISKLKLDEKQGFYGTILSITDSTNPNSKLTKVEIENDNVLLKLVFFNSTYLKKILKINKRYFFFGKPSYFGNEICVVNPIFIEDNENFTPSIMPIYGLSRGLKNNELRKTIKNILDSNTVLDYIDIDSINQKLKNNDPGHLNYENLSFSLNNIHFPNNRQTYLNAKRRLIFDEFFTLKASYYYYKTKNSDKNKKKYEINDETVEYFTEYQKLFDFELTDSQKEVMRSIENDLSSDEVMNRLLLGDVGSGKTIVFSYALYLSKKNNFQSIVLVPTTFLAIQHFNTLTKLFKNTDIKVSLLISSTKKSGETKIKNEIKTGDIDIVIGTTSLISPDISFKNLNLVVFDEQHKFGVAQKETLVKNTSINTISVSATPIPRTLSHSIFGKLNTSVLTEKPKNRIKTKTFVLMKHEKEQAYEALINEVNKGNQAIIVSPVINESDYSFKSNLNNVKKIYDDFLTMYKYEKNLKTRLLHGELKNEEKEKIINEFFNNEINVLISTTLIEIGIDSKDTSIIIIENAEMFGLSTLHQLRGRVGRGNKESFCYLLNENNSDNKRLRILSEYDDGFQIAKKDLELRGPGEFLGLKQSGIFNFKLADFELHKNIFEDASKALDFIVSKDKDLEKIENVKLKEKLLKEVNDGN